MSVQPSGDDEAHWRRPAPGAAEQPSQSAPASPPTQPYLGPPRPDRPPFGWRPPIVVAPSEPRQLPVQDHPALDRTERAARTLTNGVALVATAIMFVLLLLFCGRWLF